MKGDKARQGVYFKVLSDVITKKITAKTSKLMETLTEIVYQAAKLRLLILFL